MRTPFICLALSLCIVETVTSRLDAQEAPAAPATQAIPADSGKEGGPPLELRIAAFSLMANRTVVSGSAAATSSASMTGAELVLRSLQGGGLLVRYASGNAGSGATAGKVSLLDGRVEIGSRTFVLELGYMLRNENVAGTSTQTGYARGGFRSELHFGSSGVVAGFAASYFRDPTQEKSGIQGSGIDGEASLVYVLPKLPIYVQLGFRREAWTFTQPVGASIPEEWSTVFLGAGFQIGLP